MADIDHNLLTGKDLHNSKIDEFPGAPLGSVSPPAINYLLRDTTSGKLYVSTGLTNTDWILVKGSSDAADVVYQGGDVSTALDSLNTFKPIVNTFSGTPNALTFGSIDSSTKRVKWYIEIEVISTPDLYASVVSAAHIPGIDFEWDEDDLKIIGAAPTGLAIDVVQVGNNLALKITTLVAANIKVRQENL